MPNPSKKSGQFFAFLSSFAVTVAVGIFAWLLIFNSEFILSKINLAFLKASVYHNVEIKEIFPAASTENFDEAYKPNQEEPAVDESLDIYTGVGGPDPALILFQEKQELLDDIAEKIDIIQQQVNQLVAESQDQEDQIEKTEENEEEQEEEEEEQNIEELVEIKTIYQKIFISEVQIGATGDQKQEFVELYNPNDIEIDLTGWYLQKKTKSGSDYSSFVSDELFFGKKIFPKSYFLICREGYYFNGLCDIFTDQALSKDSSLVLKNSNNDVSDKLGFGLAQDYMLFPAENPENGKTIGRKVYPVVNVEHPTTGVLPYRIEQDTNNNSSDFEIQLPTPKAENITYVEPAVSVAGVSSGGGSPAAVIYPKILISEVQIAPIGQRFVEFYNPNDADVDLTGWYIQRKTKTADSWASFVSSSKFEGKTILANSYFLISRELENSDILLDITLSDDNSLALKDPNGDIQDKLGFGQVQEYELSPSDGPAENKSIGRKFLESQTEQDTDDNLSDFEIQEPTPKSENITWQEPIVEDPIIIEEKDITPPSVNFALESLQSALSFSINFIIDDISGAVTSSGIDSYVFQWQENGGEWEQGNEVKIELAPVTATGTWEFTGEDETEYNFQIKAKDTAENESAWLPEIPVLTKISIPKKVLINEIQISPIEQRFVELYNPQSYEINLTGWYLQRKTADDTPEDPWRTFISSTNFENKIILANGYFLISREIENSDILSGIALKNDNSLVLKNSDGDIIDKVGWGTAQDFETASASIPDGGKSIVRKELGQDTDDNSQDFIISDTSTPKADNF